MSASTAEPTGAAAVVPASEAKTAASTSGLPIETLPIPASATLPYNWGKFQGWTMLIGGPIVAICNLGLLAVIGLPLAIISGYAFAWRKKYAVAMTYAWMVFYTVIALLQFLVALTEKTLRPEQQGEEIGKGIGILIVGLVFWGLCSVYYRKRRAEFIKA